MCRQFWLKTSTFKKKDLPFLDMHLGLILPVEFLLCSEKTKNDSVRY